MAKPISCRGNIHVTSFPLQTNDGDWLQVVLVGVPGAFTPVCSSSHIPGFVEKVKDFADKGVNYIGVIANNE